MTHTNPLSSQSIQYPNQMSYERTGGPVQPESNILSTYQYFTVQDQFSWPTGDSSSNDGFGLPTSSAIPDLDFPSLVSPPLDNCLLNSPVQKASGSFSSNNILPRKTDDSNPKEREYPVSNGGQQNTNVVMMTSSMYGMADIPYYSGNGRSHFDDAVWSDGLSYQISSDYDPQTTAWSTGVIWGCNQFGTGDRNAAQRHYEQFNKDSIVKGDE